MKKHSKKIIRRSQRDYSFAFKLQVVQQVEKGELTLSRTEIVIHKKINYEDRIF